jgi:glycerol-3-phosphate dehydrogenase subunit B
MELGGAIGLFREMTRIAGYPFVGQIQNTHSLPGILGDFQSVALAPEVLWNATPREGASTLVVGIRGLTCFDENFMVERLNEQVLATNSGCKYTARQISFDRDLGIPVTIVRIAKCFDRDPGFRAELTDALQQVASGFDSILVPGVLGLTSTAQQLLELEQQVGCPVCETPTLPPSIPGLRLFHHLERYLHTVGVEIYQGFPVEKLEIYDGLCTEVHVASPGHALILRGESVVLAAGQSSVSLLGKACTGHNEQMHPLASTGSVMARNLFVAGSLLQSDAGIKGDAMDILTGYRAGNLAAATAVLQLL